MGRPVNANSEETKERLLEAAGELFATQGIGSTSVREIAQKAGVNGALVSHYFGGKEGLYGECVESMYRQLSELQESLLPKILSAESLRSAIELAVIDGFHLGRKNRNSLRLVMRHILDRGQLPKERFQSVQSPFLATIPALVAPHSMQSENELRWSIQSLVFLVVRYALSSDEELDRLNGGTGVALQATEEHLTRIAGEILSLVPTT
jgi:AcrR family transcriptional regulator